MKINTKYLKEFVKFELGTLELKNLLETMGFEIEEIVDHSGVDVIEVEVTPNRPDWLSHYGIARDMYAKDPGLKLIKGIDQNQSGIINKKDFNIIIENNDDCPRYSGCIIKGIEVSESSEEVKKLLLSLGLRPINSLVDISNLILMTYGHPIHIFDLDKLEGGEINIRRARKSEKLKLLDERDIELNENFLVIADEKKPVALAGIMGGYDSGVNFETKNILIESAVFDPIVVRKSARKIGLSTDASFRFERGTDILCTMDIIGETIKKINESLKKPVQVFYSDDVFPVDFVAKSVKMDKSFPAKYSGIEIEHVESEKILNRLGFVTEDKDSYWNVTVPSYRVDIYGKQDLIEEIVRIYGYDNLNSVLPAISTEKIKKWPLRELRKKIGQFLINNGAYESMNYSFHKKEDNAFFADEKLNIEIKNPLGLDFSIMRNSLIPGLLKNISTNINQQVKSVFLFEIGDIYNLKDNNILQTNMLSILTSGLFSKQNWKAKKSVEWDLFLFKSMVQNLFSRLFINAELKRSSISHFDDETGFNIVCDGKSIGTLGILKKEVLEYYKLTEPVFITEINLEKVKKIKKNFKLKKWNVFPSTKRDFSFFIDKNRSYDAIKKLINDIKPEKLISFELFDLYEGKGNPEDKVSLSLSFTYQDEFKTMENDDVNNMHDHFIREMTEKLQLIQR